MSRITGLNAFEPDAIQLVSRKVGKKIEKHSKNLLDFSEPLPLQGFTSQVDHPISKDCVVKLLKMLIETLEKKME